MVARANADHAQATLRDHVGLYAQGRSLGLDMMFAPRHSGQPRLHQRIRHGAQDARRPRLQPIVTALFANSPFLDGKPTGALSQRSNIWRDTDPDARACCLRLRRRHGFERYVDYALDAPLYFVKRGEIYHDVAGASFHDLLAGKLPQLPGERATIADWANHLSTIFPEVRLKTYLECAPTLARALTSRRCRRCSPGCLRRRGARRR